MLSLNRSENDTSATLDLFRAVAAQMVCVGHAISFFFLLPAGWPLGGWPAPQNIGVLIFFALSGFLISHTLIERTATDENYGFRDYVVDRIARIYSGVIPAVLTVAIFDYLFGRLLSRSVAYSDGRHFLLNLGMFQAYHGVLSDRLSVSAFGTASPLWTLGVEFHIYMFAGAMFFIAARRGYLPPLAVVASFFGQTALWFLLRPYQSDGIGQSLTLLWLCGASAYLIAKVVVVPARLATAGLLVSTILFLAPMRGREEYFVPAYPLLGAALYFAVCLTQKTRAIARRPDLRRGIRFFADYSFTLYLIHYSVMTWMVALFPSAGLLGAACAVALSNLLAVLLAIATEMHHRSIAKRLNQLLGWRRHSAHSLRAD